MKKMFLFLALICWLVPEGGVAETLQERIAQRLPNLAHTKLEALMKRLNRKPPQGFYNCLCSHIPHPGNVGVSYHPGPTGTSPSCSKPGLPCVYAGYGCSRRAFPPDPKAWAACLGSCKYSDGATLVDVIAGEVESFRKKRAENIARKQPYTAEDEHQMALERMRLITRLRMQGYPMDRIERMISLVRKRILRADQHDGRLPSALDTLGLAPPGGYEKKSDQWNQVLLRRFDKMVNDALASEKPMSVLGVVRNMSRALERFDIAAQEDADAIVMETCANQKLAEQILESLPVSGELLDIYAVVFSQSLSGEQQTTLDRMLRAAGVLGPFGFEYLLKKSNRFQKAVAGMTGFMKKAAAHTAATGMESVKTLAKTLGRDPAEWERCVSIIGEVLTKERQLFSKKLSKKADDAVKQFKTTREGLQDAMNRSRDINAADDLLRRMKRAGETGDTSEFRKLVKEFQQNKTAQSLVQDPGTYGPQLNKAINGRLGEIYHQADNKVFADIKELMRASDDQLDDLARKFNIKKSELEQFRKKVKKTGLDPDQLHVKRQDFSGNDPTKVGRDRDVTFSISAKDAHGNEIDLFDVHHNISEPSYNQRFFEACNDGKILMKNGVVDHKEIENFAKSMDQTVTSKWHPEAYAVGDTTFRDFLRATDPSAVQHIEAVADTISYKSTHWFEHANSVKSSDMVQYGRDTAEGMRQATKQWDRFIEPRLKQYLGTSGTAKKLALPAELEEGLNIFRQVEKGKLTARQAEAALAGIGTSKEKVVTSMGVFFETMEKDLGTGFRKAGNTALNDMLKNVAAKKGTRKWGERSLGLINDSLQKGKISYSDFLNQRNKVIRSLDKPGEALTPDATTAKAFNSWITKMQTSRVISRTEARILRDKSSQ